LSLLTKLDVDPAAVPNYILVNGLLKYKNRIWVGSNSALQMKLLHACHVNAIGGHSRVPVTYLRPKKMFAWIGMKKVVTDFVKTCVICQQSKPDRHKLPGLLQPLPVPSGAWQIISLDFVEGLPVSGRFNSILVVVDSFTKCGHFIPLHHPFSAASVAKAFMNQVYRLHGLPTTIVSDRDSIFTSLFRKELFRLADVTLQMSSSYHSQTDGQTERLNQTMETFLRCFINACPSKWADWLTAAEFWYNTSEHSSIGRSPFEALYGYSPKHFGMAAEEVVSTPELSSWLSQREVMNKLIHQHLLRAQQRMKRQADKKRSEWQFSVGDNVFLKLQLYVQSSLAPRSNKKLAFKYFGPYKIVAKVGSVAYKLDLPSYSYIHPVFHVSQLKPARLPVSEVLAPLPSDVDSPRILEQVLQSRMVSINDHQVEQALIKWSG
jgi:hypothetical protein